ncbi:MAG: hypothetical protein P4L99_29870 [Chthoniobacter sp.]|nr:hypothetical protein [Chthoniobacter sp.]
MELTPTIERLLSLPFGRVVDIGTAEGYYAVGFAHRLRQVQVIGFEADAAARQLLEKLATLNGVADRVEIRGFCRAEDVLQIVAEATKPVLIICDAEGGEKDIFLSSPPADFAKATLVIETHEFVVPGITNSLMTHFARTHHIERIDTRERTYRDLPSVFQSRLCARWLAKGINELRPCTMSWLVLEPNASSGL